jgi:GTPase SAR1 family protein
MTRAFLLHRSARLNVVHTPQSTTLRESMSLKLIIMGTGGVGKSSITHRFVSGDFSEKVRIPRSRAAARC